MSTLETILIRAMNDTTFADLLFTQTEKALADYPLTTEEHTQLKKLSRAEFEVLATEQRNSMASDGRSYVTGYFDIQLDGIK